MMEDREITCELVDERDLDTRYLAGRLTPDEASAFEAHYFGCDRCFALVRAGVAVQTSRRPARAWWRPLALAAAVLLAVVGSWRVIGRRPVGAPDAIRGGGDSLVARTQRQPSGWRAIWSPANGAAFYRLRVFDGDGQLLLQREIADTVIAIATDSLGTAPPRLPLHVEVEAFDALRRPISRSPLIRLDGRRDST